MQYRNNLMTYLKWRGDLSLKDYAFNEVDALILSELVYVRLDGIVPGVGAEGTITIKEAGEKYLKSMEPPVLAYEKKEELLDYLKEMPRFANMTLCNYVSNTNLVQHQQFAAMHINVAPNMTFIAFRGTDSTIVGWREDFNMSFMMPVPAQQSAVDYVNQTAKGMFRKFWFGGHSKGGNLAVYAGVFCNPKLQKKIMTVYSFDGPGFNRNMVETLAYKTIEDRIVAYVPDASIVGMLMEHEEDYKVVCSSEYSIMQHEGFSWLVDRDKFVLTDEVNEFSKSLSVTLKTWLAELSVEERKALVDAFFHVFEEAGIYDLSEIMTMDVRTTAILLKAVAMVPQEHRDKVGKLIKLLIEESTKK